MLRAVGVRRRSLRRYPRNEISRPAATSDSPDLPSEAGVLKSDGCDLLRIIAMKCRNDESILA